MSQINLEIIQKIRDCVTLIKFEDEIVEVLAREMIYVCYLEISNSGKLHSKLLEIYEQTACRLRTRYQTEDYNFNLVFDNRLYIFSQFRKCLLRYKYINREGYNKIKSNNKLLLKTMAEKIMVEEMI